MKVSIEISSKRIADIMITAIEGNHMTRTWCEGVYLAKAPKSWEKPKGDVWYSSPDFYAGDFQINVTEIVDESKPARGANLKTHTLSPVEFARGFQLMAEKSAGHLADFINENEDIITADVFLQYATLGEVIYG